MHAAPEPCVHWSEQRLIPTWISNLGQVRALHLRFTASRGWGFPTRTRLLLVRRQELVAGPVRALAGTGAVAHARPVALLAHRAQPEPRKRLPAPRTRVELCVRLDQHGPRRAVSHMHNRNPRGLAAHTVEPELLDAARCVRREPHAVGPAVGLRLIHAAGVRAGLIWILKHVNAAVHGQPEEVLSELHPALERVHDHRSPDRDLHVACAQHAHTHNAKPPWIASRKCKNSNQGV
mmetsp:Transcript_50180/g.76351  ORF Transcript_50180/g.76351 Transcript_50180/m.76351 type:complete len:235 (-) Transcript_50180:1469-2173(-)